MNIRVCRWTRSPTVQRAAAVRAVDGPDVPALSHRSAASVSASSAKRRSPCDEGVLGVHGPAGSFCTITSSNVDAIEVGSRVIYRPGGRHSGRLAGQRRRPRLPGPGNNRAFGHCTLDLRRSRPVHVLGRDREVHRVPCPCRCLAAVGRGRRLALGRDVQLQSARLSRELFLPRDKTSHSGPGSLDVNRVPDDDLHQIFAGLHSTRKYGRGFFQHGLEAQRPSLPVRRESHVREHGETRFDSFEHSGGIRRR